MEKDITNGLKQAGVPISISDKIDLKPKLIKRDREVQHSYQREKSFAIFYSYAPNKRRPKFRKEAQLKSHIDSHTLIIDFS